MSLKRRNKKTKDKKKTKPKGPKPLNTKGIKIQPLAAASPIITKDKVEKTNVPKVQKRSSGRNIMTQYSFGKQKSLHKYLINKDENENIKMDECNLLNLANYLDWTSVNIKSNGKVNSDLYDIAMIIWEYCQAGIMTNFKILLNEASKHTIESDRKPILISTSMRGDLVYCYKISKSHVDYSETVYHIVLLPKLDSIYMKGVTHIRTLKDNLTCVWWEIDNMPNAISHICFGKDHSIYFTNGEAIYKISRDIDNNYLDDFEEIYAPASDNHHITCLWRQFNETYFCIQNWDTEDDIEIYKIKHLDKDKGKNRRKGSTASVGYQSGNDSPRNSTNSPRRKRSRTSSRGDVSASPRNSPRGGGKMDFGPVSKIRNFTLTYNQRIWQLSSLMYGGKALIGISACAQDEPMKLLNIKLKTKIKVLIFHKKIVSPQPYNDEITPHYFFFHRPTMSYLLTLNVFDKTDKKNSKKPKWIQFRLDKNCNKINYYRTLLVPQNCIDVTWLEYDSIRDCLIGYNSMDEDKKEYTISYLPDISKLLNDDKLPELSKMELDQAKNIDKIANPLKTPISAAKVISQKEDESQSIWEHDEKIQEEMKQQQANDMIDAVLGALTSKKSNENNNKRDSKKHIKTDTNNDKVILSQAHDPFKINIKSKQNKKDENVDKTPTIKPSNSLKNKKLKGTKSPRKESGNKDPPMLKMLKEIKCEEYYQQLVDDGFDTLADLREATEDDLAEVGVKPSHIKKILKKLRL